MHHIHVNIPCWDPSLCSEDTSHGAKDAFAELSPVLPFMQTAWVQSYLRFALPSPLWGWQLCVSSFPCCFVPAWLSEQRAGELRDACHHRTAGSAGLFSRPAAEPFLQVTAMQTYANAAAACLCNCPSSSGISRVTMGLTAQ